MIDDLHHCMAPPPSLRCRLVTVTVPRLLPARGQLVVRMERPFYVLWAILYFSTDFSDKRNTGNLMWVSFVFAEVFQCHANDELGGFFAAAMITRRHHVITQERVIQSATTRSCSSLKTIWSELIELPRPSCPAAWLPRAH